MYSNYPKRGLKWTNGWIDRGGWKPQQFSGNYFYAQVGSSCIFAFLFLNMAFHWINEQADSLAFRWTDDVELVVNSAKREVQYRSASRLGSVDFDVQRLRYNQFSRMLASKGGWEDLRQLPRLHYLSTTPFRWTNQLLDKVTALLESAVSISGYKQSFVDAWSAADKARENILSSLGHSLQQWEHIFHKEGEEFHWLIELNPLNRYYISILFH